MESGSVERWSRYRSWARILSREFEQLQRVSEEGQESMLDENGVSKPAEFFAVATKCCFEKGRALRLKHPKLYDELQRFCRQDLAEWTEKSESDHSGN